MARIVTQDTNQFYMNPTLKPVVEAFIAEHKLPPEYLSTVEAWFLPLVEEFLQLISSHHGTYIIGVSGCQGSGKSTLAELIVLMLQSMLGLRCINLSIDDFYLTHQERQALADSVHPLLVTRGVPGTHDVKLALNTIAALSESGSVSVPRFNKAIDDRHSESDWPQVQGPVDVIVLEGWCLSIPEQGEQVLAEAINELEANEDRDGTWRRYVNEAIKTQYKALYDKINYLVMLKAPDFEKVYEWRQNQEEKLKAFFYEKKVHENKSNEKKLQEENSTEIQEHRMMSPDELKRFIQHYERVTRHGLESLPALADTVFQLTAQQTIEKRL